MAAKDHFGNPMIEQRKLAEGKAAVELGPRGIITVSGEDRLTWLHSLLSQNLKNLQPGQSAEALLLDPQGHIEQVIHFLDDGLTSWLIVEAEGREALVAWLTKMIFRSKVELTDRSDDFAVIGSFGAGVPQAAEANGLALVWQDPWPGVVAGGIRYSTTDAPNYNYFESLVEPGRVAEVFTTLEPAGLLAAEALRIAAYRPRQATEVDEKSLPHELDWLSTAVHMSKGCYRGQETVAKVHNLGHPPRRLTFLHLDGSGHELPAVGAEVSVAGETQVRGRVTSTAQHFEAGPIALAVLSRSVPEDAELVVRSEGGFEVAATQQVIVPQTAGKAVSRPKLPRLLN